MVVEGGDEGVEGVGVACDDGGGGSVVGGDVEVGVGGEEGGGLLVGEGE